MKLSHLRIMHYLCWLIITLSFFSFWVGVIGVEDMLTKIIILETSLVSFGVFLFAQENLKKLIHRNVNESMKAEIAKVREVSDGSEQSAPATCGALPGDNLCERHRGDPTSEGDQPSDTARP